MQCESCHGPIRERPWEVLKFPRLRVLPLDAPHPASVTYDRHYTCGRECGAKLHEYWRRQDDIEWFRERKTLTETIWHWLCTRCYREGYARARHLEGPPRDDFQAMHHVCGRES